MRTLGILFCLLLLSPHLYAQNELIGFTQKLVQKGIIKYHFHPDDYELDRDLFRQEAVGMALSYSGSTFPANYACRNIFEDLRQFEPNYWACRIVENAVEKGLVSTYEKTFRPEDSTTRAEALAMFLKAAGVPTSKNADKYGYDFDATWWQKQVIATGYENGIISRTMPFRPNDDITRGEAFVMLHNLLIWQGEK